MVKSELLIRLKEKFPDLLPSKVDSALNCILEQMIAALENNQRIEVRGFGSFNLRQLPPHAGRNPKTGEILHLPEKISVHFKAGIELKDRVNEMHGKIEITE